VALAWSGRPSGALPSKATPAVPRTGAENAPAPTCCAHSFDPVPLPFRPASRRPASRLPASRAPQGKYRGFGEKAP
jgi:hypothetical protein